MSAQPPSSQLQVQDPAAAAAVEEQIRSLTVTLPINEASEYTRLILTEGVIIGLGIGGAAVGGAWEGSYMFMEGKTHPAVQYIGSAFGYATVANLADRILRVIANKYGGTMEEEKLTGLKKAAAIAVDITIGTLTVGGGFALAHDKLQSATLSPDLEEAVYIFIVTFFLYWVFRLMINSAFLRVRYRKKIARPEHDWKTYFAGAIKDGAKELVTLRNLLTNFCHRVSAFAVYPLLANVVATFWDNKYGGQHTGVASIINLFWFFAEYDAFVEAWAYLADTVLPAEAIVEEIGEEGEGAQA